MQIFFFIIGEIIDFHFAAVYPSWLHFFLLYILQGCNFKLKWKKWCKVDC